MSTPAETVRPFPSPPKPSPPRVVRTACILWITGLLVGLIGQYLLSPLTELGAARARVLASPTSGLTRQQIDTAVTLVVVGALVCAGVLAVVGGLVVTAMWAGRRWARPTLIGVALCSGLTDLRQGPHLAEALNGTSLRTPPRPTRGCSGLRRLKRHESVALPHRSGDGPLPTIGRYYAAQADRVACTHALFVATPTAFFLPWVIGAGDVIWSSSQST